MPTYDVPGIYIEEFTPGAPIEGVGTSTAAFIGTAARGPIDQPTLIQSWDAFKATFGDFIAGKSTGYLGPAVYGFFLNGGTTCYVLRHGTCKLAAVNLDGRDVSKSPALVATALQEGTPDGDLTVDIQESSILEDMFKTAGGPAVLNIQRAETSITAINTDLMTLTVADNTGFVPGDWVFLTDNNNTNAEALVDSTGSGKNTLVLSGPVEKSLDFSVGNIRTANLKGGRRTFRVTTPAGLALGAALPRGATIMLKGFDVSVTPQAVSEICTVESAGGDQVTVNAPLKNTYSLSDKNKLPSVASLEFDVLVSESTVVKETFSRMAMNPNHPNYWHSCFDSQYIRLTAPSNPPQAEDLRPLADQYSLAGGVLDNPINAWGDIGNNPGQYLDLLKPVAEISLVCIPGGTTDLIQQAVRDHCESMADRFAILDSMLAATVDTIPEQLAKVVSAKGYAALYFPWILAHNPVSGQDELWPPSGHMAGIYARSDMERGVHKAPANVAIRGALGLQYRLTDVQQGPLNLKGINVLRVFQGEAQPMIWGGRTTATDRNWQYVNIRRLFIFLEQSIEAGIRWAVFEPNNLQLWQKLKRSITEFLTRVWRDGALFGKTTDEAFYVRIDEILNPESTKRLGRLYIEIGVRPSYPAEFIIVRIGIWQGGSDVSET